MGVLGGSLADWTVRKFGIKIREKCLIEVHDDFDTEPINWRHFATDHIWKHILKKHLPKIFFWILGSIIFVTIVQSAYNLEVQIVENGILLLILAGCVGILPLAGPNIIFITLFAQGILPFSVVLTNSVVQDGHGLLPLLGFSLKDTMKIKLFKLMFGFGAGLTLFTFGF